MGKLGLGTGARDVTGNPASAASLGCALGGLGLGLAAGFGRARRGPGRRFSRRRLAACRSGRGLLVSVLVGRLGSFGRLRFVVGGLVARRALGRFLAGGEIALAFLVRFEIGFVPAAALQAKHRRGDQFLERLLLAARTLLQRRIGDFL